MISMSTNRRNLLGGGAALAAAALLPRGTAALGAVNQASELKPMRLPPPIGRAERLQRLNGARKLMNS